MRNYDLKSAVNFFQTASRKFSQSSRLLSEAAICFKLGGNANDESILKEAILLEPKKEKKYRDLYDYARFYTPIAFRYSDRRGIVVKIDYEKMNGVLQSENQSISFRWNERLNLLYSKLKVNDEVFFDVTDRNYAMNVEPVF